MDCTDLGEPILELGWTGVVLQKPLVKVPKREFAEGCGGLLFFLKNYMTLDRVESPSTILGLQ